MMGRPLYKTAVILLTLSLMFSSVGINLYTHVCHTKGITEVSVVPSGNLEVCSECSANDQECRTDLRDCCSSHVESQTPCCEHNSQFLKASHEFVTLEITEIKAPIYILGLVSQSVLHKIIKYIDYSKTTTHYSGISPPFQDNFRHFISSLTE
jgi:hypothetical protein